MRSQETRLHDITQYQRLNFCDDVLRRARRLGAGVLSALCMITAIDIGVTEVTVPNSPPVARFIGDSNCRDADFVVVYVNPTGKSVSQHLAANNIETVEKNNGASLVTEYGTSGDVHEFRDVIDASLSQCVEEGRKKPVVFNSMSLGGKYSQWVINAGLQNGRVVANIMEASPGSVDTIRDSAGRLAVSVLSDADAVPVTQGFVLAASIIEEERRYGLLKVASDPYVQRIINDNVRETNPKVLGWQAIANSRPYPLPLQDNDNTTPVYYIYSAEDSVVNTELALWEIGLLTRAQVQEYKIPPAQDAQSYNHAEGWILESRANQYDITYGKIYGQIATRLAVLWESDARSLSTQRRV